MENSTEIPQTIKNRTATSGYLSKTKQNTSSKNIFIKDLLVSQDMESI